MAKAGEFNNQISSVKAYRAEIESPFLANAVAIDNAQKPIWLKFDDASPWILADDLILRENIHKIKWTRCDPLIYEPIFCSQNIFFSPRITFINTKVNLLTSTDASIVAYRSIIRQIGGEPGVSSTPAFRIRSRAEWGADENLRLKSAHTVSSSLNQASEKNELWWPLVSMEKVEKIIVHHTATSGHITDPEAGMRAIYLYHAIEKNWGDIGYHYVIGQRGEVFQGRAGDDKAIGGHAYGFNIGTIGIAVMGNFDNQQVPVQASGSLSQLIDYLSSKYSIQKNGVSIFHDISMPNILGHRELNATSCPGNYLYNEAVKLRGGLKYTRVQNAIGDDTQKSDQNGASSRQSNQNSIVNTNIAINESPDYQFSIVSGANQRVGQIGDVVQFALVLKNTGNVAWDSGTYLKSVSGWNNSFIKFQAQSNRASRVAEMAQRTVQPSSTALFRFSVLLQKQGEIELDVFPVWGKNQPVRPIVIQIKVIN